MQPNCSMKASLKWCIVCFPEVLGKQLKINCSAVVSTEQAGTVLLSASLPSATAGTAPCPWSTPWHGGNSGTLRGTHRTHRIYGACENLQQFWLQAAPGLKEGLNLPRHPAACTLQHVSAWLGNWEYSPLTAGLLISTFNPNHKCITFFTKFLPEVLKLLGHWFNTLNQGISRNAQIPLGRIYFNKFLYKRPFCISYLPASWKLLSASMCYSSYVSWLTIIS